MIKHLLAAAVAVALIASATPAVAADATQTISGSLDFSGVTAASHVEVAAYAEPATMVGREGMAKVGATAVDYVPGNPVVPFSLTVPSGSTVYLNFDSTTTDGMVDQFWLGSGGQVAGAWPVVSPITATMTVGTVKVVRSGGIDVALEYAARQVCVLKLDRTPVTCATKDISSPSFDFEGLYPGEYIVSAKGATKEYTVRVSEGFTNEVDFTEGGVIIGRVKNSSGKALADVQVWTVGANGERVTGFTDRTGRYELSSLATGNAEVFASDGVGGYVNLSGAYGPVLVEHIRQGIVKKAPTIVLRKAGRVVFTPKVTRADSISVKLMKGDRVYEQLELDYRDGIARGEKTISANPGTYKLVTIDRNGQRKASSTKIVIREGRTLRLGTVARTASTYDVSGTVGGDTKSVRLYAGPKLSDAVMTTATVRDGVFQLRSVARGVYYLRAVNRDGVIDGFGTRVKVTGDVKRVKARAVAQGEIGASVSYNGRPFAGGSVILDGVTAQIDAAGRFTAPAANRDYLPARAITSPSLGSLTPYAFGVPTVTFDGGSPVVLDSTSIYGG